MRPDALLAAIVGCLAATPAAAQPQPVAPVRITEQGAVCDGRTDDARAIAAALARGKELRVPVLVPVGTCAYGDVLRVDGVTLRGAGERSVLHALDWRRSAIFMSGTAPAVADLKLTTVAAPSRQAPWEMTRITVFGATDFAIERVVIDGAAAAGIQTARGATRGRIAGNVVRNTLSDGIHITGGASHLLVEGNLVEATGDDGIAVVTYRRDAAAVHHVTARDNTVRRLRFGRNMSVVGGEHVLYENNLLQGNDAGLACLYIAQEGGALPTVASRHVTARRNTLQDCGSVATGHGAAMLFSDGQEANADVLLVANDVRSPRAVGIRVRGPHVGLRLHGNRITGSPRALDLGGVAVDVVPFAGEPAGHATARPPG